MGKGKGLTFTIFAALGALAGYATYMASKDEFSNDTKDSYENVVNKIRNVGTEIKRTYFSIGDKEEFTNNSKDLGKSALKLAEKTGDLVSNATSDMYKFAKVRLTKAINSAKDDDKSSYDDLDESYLKSKKKVKKLIKTKKKKK